MKSSDIVANCRETALRVEISGEWGELAETLRDVADEVERLRAQVKSGEEWVELLPDDAFDSKDWRHSDPVGRIQWLLSMVAEKDKEIAMWVDMCNEANATLVERLRNTENRTNKKEG